MGKPEDETFGERLEKIRREHGFTQSQLARESGLTDSQISELKTRSDLTRLTKTPVLKCIKGLIKLHAITTRDEAEDLLFLFFTEREETFLPLEQLGPKGGELLTLLKEEEGVRSDFGKMLHEDFLDPLNITQQQLAKKSGVATNIISEIVTGEWFVQSQTLSDDLYAIFLALFELYGVISITLADKLLKTIPQSNLNKERRRDLLTSLIRENVINPSHLTLHQTPFIGRDEDIKEIYFRLQKMRSEGIRFLTLVGLPGVGKTEVARQTKLLVQTLENFEEVLQISFEVETSVTDILQEIDEYLRGKEQQNQTLIILDNCELIEHIDEAKISFYRYLEKHSQLTILATSRISFSDGEYEVKPLGVSSSKSESVENLQNYGAIKLFLAYANADTPFLELTEQNKEIITAICKKLDALPLALLLAASLVGNLGLDELYKLIQQDNTQTSEYSLADFEQKMILDHDLNMELDNLLSESADLLENKSLIEMAVRIRTWDFSKIKLEKPKEFIETLLFTHPRDLLLDILQQDDIQTIEYIRADYDRHRTLEKLLQASYNLLQVEEKELFRRLGIFFAPCSIKGVTEVCELGELPHIINLLSILKRNHLITFQNEQVVISHNIIRSFARRQIDRGTWKLLKLSFDIYFTILLFKYRKLQEVGELEVNSTLIIDNFTNIKGMNWLNRKECKFAERAIIIGAYINAHPFHYPSITIKAILRIPRSVLGLMFTDFKSFKRVFSTVGSQKIEPPPSSSL